MISSAKYSRGPLNDLSPFSPIASLLSLYWPKPRHTNASWAAVRNRRRGSTGLGGAQDGAARLLPAPAGRPASAHVQRLLLLAAVLRRHGPAAGHPLGGLSPAGLTHHRRHGRAPGGPPARQLQRESAQRAVRRGQRGPGGPHGPALHEPHAPHPPLPPGRGPSGWPGAAAGRGGDRQPREGHPGLGWRPPRHADQRALLDAAHIQDLRRLHGQVRARARQLLRTLVPVLPPAPPRVGARGGATARPPGVQRDGQDGLRGLHGPRGRVALSPRAHPRVPLHAHLHFLDLFFRRLEPDADFAEEVNVNNDRLGLPLPVRVNEENLEGIDFKKHRPSVSMQTGAVEGCEISGSISVNRVPGMLVFTARSDEVSFNAQAVDVSHIVNHFSFGQVRRTENLFSGGAGLLAAPSNRYPLDRKTYTIESENVTVQHFLNVRTCSIQGSTVVSLMWTDLYPANSCDDRMQVVGFDNQDNTRKTHLQQRSYEFSATTTQYEDKVPSALFTFDISPLVVQITTDSIPFYHFITHLCAVIGGVFTILGLVDSGVFHAMNSIKKKQQLGKLS
ncbi:hypothetical protein ON010_g2185 [Phytophthora cinnamomi]|nr:hypothetical protein ON010_g2185 [Phytophthora cinnamomi]